MPSLSEKESRCGNGAESPPEIIRAPCGVFPVENGVPVIGMGLFFILVSLIPLLLGIGVMELPAILFGGFGIFLIWLGLTK